MHIGFIEDTLLHGGTQIWVTEAARYFLDKGESVTVLTPQGGWVAGECEEAGARIVTYNYKDVVSKRQTHEDTWADALRACDVAVCTVHPPRDSFHCVVFAAECIEKHQLKTVLIPKTGTIVPSYRREFYAPDAAVKSRVIAIADFTRRYLIETYKIPQEHIALIYQGTNIDTFTPDAGRKVEATRRYPVPAHASPVLGNVGSFEARKGQEGLLEALARLVAGPLPGAHLVLVGGGPDEAKLRGKARALGLAGHVSFFPFTRKPAHVFELLDILVLPSLYKEGLPNVLLEALAMGVPVVASNIAGVPEVVWDGETGCTVEAGHGEQLAGAIAKLWSKQSDYAQMCRNGRKLMATHFDKRKQFERFLAYFYKLVSG